MKIFKKINYSIAGLAVLMLFFTSCEEDNNIAPLDNFTLSEATVVAPLDNFSLALERTNRQEVLRFEWEPSESTANFPVTYTVMLDESDGDFSEPLLEQQTTSEGEDAFLEISFSTLDDLLSQAGFSPNEVVALQWRVEARSINQVATTDTAIALQRFDIPGPPETLFLAGAATEAGANISNALAMNRLVTADGTATNTFELYTALESGLGYNFYTTKASSTALVYSVSGQTIEIDDTPIIAPESAVYRVTVDFDAATVALFRIDMWSIVGNVIPNQWDGDEALAYQGNGVWEATIQLLDFNAEVADERFVFRANEDWGQVLKQVPNTINTVAFEATAGDLGYDTLNDVSVSELGFQRITLNLNGDGYSYTIAPGEAPEPNSNTTIEDTPETLFISGSATEVGAVLSNALEMRKFTLVDEVSGTAEDIFEIYTTLNQDASYNFYSSTSANAMTYTLTNGNLELGDTAITATDETAVYKITVNFTTATVTTDRINMWSIVGNVIPDAWNGDAPLTYQGNGVWQGTIELIDADSADASKRFVFRANGDWALVFKERPETTTQELVFEANARKLGFSDGLNDITVDSLGEKTITLTLSGNNYFYTIE